MIITHVQFHNCDAEILKMNFKRRKVNPDPPKSSSLFLVTLIFLNHECASYFLKTVLLKYQGFIQEITGSENGPFEKIGDFKTDPSQKSKTLKRTLKFTFIM